MHPSFVVRLITILVCCLVLTPAWAETPDEVARKHFDQGKQLAASGKYAEAYREFEAGYKATPRPAFLFNMGEAARGMGDVAKAREAYERFLAAEPTGPVANTARLRLVDMEKNPPKKPSPPKAAPPPPAPKQVAPPAPPKAAPPVAAPAPKPAPAPASTSTTTTPAPTPAKTPAPATTTTTATPTPLAPAKPAPAKPAAVPSPKVAAAQHASATHSVDAYREPAAPTGEGRPIWKKWPFWAAVGGVVATSIVVTAAVASGGDEPTCGAGCIDLR